jgi:TonB family protein
VPAARGAERSAQLTFAALERPAMSIRCLILAVSFISVFAFATAFARADECPVRVSSVNLEGKGIAGHVYRYRVVLSANSGSKPPSIGLQIGFGTSRAPLHVVASDLRMDEGDETYNDVVIIERPTADMSDATVVDTDSGNVALPCTSTTVSVGDSSNGLMGWDVPAGVVTLDDTKITSPDADRVDLLAGESKDATFTKQGILNYPEVAQEMNVSGIARALVKIGPSGKLDDARIAYSSGSKALDDAALASVHESAFAESTFDGIPVEDAYDVIYEFVLDTPGSGDFDPLATPDALRTYCPAVLNGISLATGLFSNTAYWYDVDLATTRAKFDSVSLDVVGTHPPVKSVFWRTSLTGVGNNSYIHNKQDYLSEDGALFWAGDALAAGIVHEATPHLKPTVACKPYGVHVGYDLDRDSIVATAETNRPWLDAPIVESVLPARFKSVTWPNYIPSTTDPATAVALDVRVHVTQLGEAVVAIVRNASLAPGFASAALAAAMASTYVVPHTADGVPLTQTFDTVYVYVPAK